MLLYEVCCLDSLDCATDTTALPLDSEGSMDGSTKGLYRSNYYPLPTVMELQILPIASRTLVDLAILGGYYSSEKYRFNMAMDLQTGLIFLNFG
jgi:hypothetical protein